MRTRVKSRGCHHECHDNGPCEADSGDPQEHRFHVVADDGVDNRRTNVVTLRTARVLARELADHIGVDAMMRAIVATPCDCYGSLRGVQFHDRSRRR